MKNINDSDIFASMRRDGYFKCIETNSILRDLCNRISIEDAPELKGLQKLREEEYYERS